MASDFPSNPVDAKGSRSKWTGRQDLCVSLARFSDTSKRNASGNSQGHAVWRVMRRKFHTIKHSGFCGTNPLLMRGVVSVLPCFCDAVRQKTTENMQLHLSYILFTCAAILSSYLTLTLSPCLSLDCLPSPWVYRRLCSCTMLLTLRRITAKGVHTCITYFVIS